MSPYANASSITGPLMRRQVVHYTDTLQKGNRVALYLWGSFLVLSSAALVTWILIGGTPSPAMIAVTALMLGIELIRITQTATLWIFARMAKDPIPMRMPVGLRVAIHTTIVPNKEPFELVAQTLLAMKAIRYPQGTVDVCC